MQSRGSLVIQCVYTFTEDNLIAPTSGNEYQVLKDQSSALYEWNVCVYLYGEMHCIDNPLVVDKMSNTPCIFDLKTFV